MGHAVSESTQFPGFVCAKVPGIYRRISTDASIFRRGSFRIGAKRGDVMASRQVLGRGDAARESAQHAGQTFDLAAALMPPRTSLPTLLCSTALASTLGLSIGLAPTPAVAQAVNLPGQVAPVVINNVTNCNFAGDCIFISTTGNGNFINLTNSGVLISTGGRGIATSTSGASGVGGAGGIGGSANGGNGANGAAAGPGTGGAGGPGGPGGDGVGAPGGAGGSGTGGGSDITVVNIRRDHDLGRQWPWHFGLDGWWRWYGRCGWRWRCGLRRHRRHRRRRRLGGESRRGRIGDRRDWWIWWRWWRWRSRHGWHRRRGRGRHGGRERRHLDHQQRIDHHVGRERS